MEWPGRIADSWSAEELYNTHYSGNAASLGDAYQGQQPARASSYLVSSSIQSLGYNDDTRGILRLPDDILEEISWQFVSLFLHSGQAADPLDTPDFWTNSVNYKWITVAHICCRWRHVVLSIPWLWAGVPLFGDPDRVAKTLERASQIPLTIVEHTSALDLEGKRLAMKEMHRIQHMKIVLNRPTLETLIHLAPTQAPVLETLELTYGDHDLYQPFNRDRFRSCFARWSLPSLRQLAFREHQGRTMHEKEYIPEIDSIQLLLRPTLVRLEIDTLARPILVSRCVELLQELPLLEKLVLGYMLIHPRDAPDIPPLPPISRTVHLPRLRELHLSKASSWIYQYKHWYGIDHKSGVAAANLLNHLTIPSSADIYFAIAHEWLSRNHIPFIFSALREKVIATDSSSAAVWNQPPPIVACDVSFYEHHNKHNFLVQLYSTTVPFTEGRQRRSLHDYDHRTIQILLRGEHDHVHLMSSLQALFNFGFPLSEVTALRFYAARDGMGTEFWLSAIRAMPGLQEIEVINSSRCFARAYHEACHSSAVPVLPNLSRVKIEDVVWYQHKAAGSWYLHRELLPPRHKDSFWEVNPLIDQVIATFSTRRTMLEEMIISSPGCFDDADIAKLESAKVAKTLKWTELSSSKWLGPDNKY